MTYQRQRPIGITILAILALLSGLVGICLPGLLLAASGAVIGLGGFFFGAVGFAGGCAGILLIIGPLAQLLFAYGAFKLLPWAWWLGIISCVISFLGAGFNIIGGADIGPTLGTVILPAIIFVYMLTPGVRWAFRT